MQVRAAGGRHLTAATPHRPGVCTLESLESEDASHSGTPSLPDSETETGWDESGSDENSSSPAPPLDLPE